MWHHVNGYDVADFARLDGGHDEADNFAFFFGDERAAVTRVQIILKLKVGISDPFAESGVVDFVKLVEIGALVITDRQRYESLSFGVLLTSGKRPLRKMPPEGGTPMNCGDSPGGILHHRVGCRASLISRAVNSV